MDKEIAEERVEECVAELETLKATMALQATERPVSSLAGGELEDENAKLRAAVRTLHERSAEEKNELSKKIRQLVRETSELASLREECEQLVRFCCRIHAIDAWSRLTSMCLVTDPDNQEK